MATGIPRFLLPQKGSIWSSRAISTSRVAQAVRHASHKASPKSKSAPTSKVPVLEKPERFNPPSHGAKLRKDTLRYPGPSLSPAQKVAQSKRRYPNMMPSEGTFMHWFLNNRSIHIYITLGTLFSLAGYTTVIHFKRTSKFADMLPQASDLFFHPIDFTRSCLEVLRLHTAAVSAETAERRKRKVEDVAKRGEFRKKHGLENEGFGGWTAKTDAEMLGPAMPTGEVIDNTALAGISGEVLEEQVQKRRKPVKKWLGIW